MPRQVEDVTFELSEIDREMVVVMYLFSRIFGHGFDSHILHLVSKTLSTFILKKTLNLVRCLF